MVFHDQAFCQRSAFLRREKTARDSEFECFLPLGRRCATAQGAAATKVVAARGSFAASGCFT
ncbi:hypothetical protein [Eggerthella lenta]|uniref:Uncharacterized protein n=1 Tax=Eggerthella lenta TaxID=84112 RepID=A0A369N7E0_EGGLN|nr:hypothetical protein [Eggerthella lenta]MCB6526307.1 hypothetical protein [Eggerthella lenta]MCG4876058.1 hypothetical protein [Eggerthella lenta]MCQ5238575.1 hypothetical protein [Eggerthella lenta]MDB1757830.1 hypothetical protein [Eggerthella lenta]MDU2820658.1 hypothetical protein [Eggerthella lenta]